MAQNETYHDDEYARDSFTLRGMSYWQLWGISIASVVFLLGLLIYTIPL